MTLGERIATLRKEKGLSQEALGELVGVSRQAVSKWEANRAIPDVNNCVAMSRVFGISLEALLELEDKKSTENTAELLGEDPIELSSGDLTEAQLRVLEKMIDKYIAAQKKLHRRWRWPLILTGCVLAVGVAWLWQWLTDMNRTIDYLHGEMAGLRSEIISGVSDQLQADLNVEHYLQVDYKTSIKQVDLKENQITYVLKAEIEEPILIYKLQFMIRQGETVWTTDMESEGGQWIGEITCSIQDDTAFYIIVEEDNGTVHREKVAVWNPEERYTLFVNSWLRGASLERSGLIPGAVEVATVYINGFARGYDQGELKDPLQMNQVEVAVLCDQDTMTVQTLDICNLRFEEATGSWFFQQDVEIAVPDNVASVGEVLTFELRVVDSYGRTYKEIISQYQVQQDGKVSPLSSQVAQVIE